MSGYCAVWIVEGESAFEIYVTHRVPLKIIEKKVLRLYWFITFLSDRTLRKRPFSYYDHLPVIK